MNKPLFFAGIGIVCLGFVLGWLFPVEGPYDYIYDEAVKEKRPSVNVPSKENKPVIIIDEEEPELIYILPPMPIIGE